jgi:hypothetical protein
MILHDIAADTVVSVMLADGWHRVTPGSLVISPLGFGPGADLGLPAFRFAEAEAGSPYQPTMLAGPLNSIIAVRLVNPSRATRSRDRTGLATAHARRVTANHCQMGPVSE